MNDLSVQLSKGDFSTFDKLSESQKSRIAQGWDKEMRLKYLTRHPVITEEEFFSQLDKIATASLAKSKSQCDEFSFLEELDEDCKIEIMKGWDKTTWISFRMQNTVSEQEVFDPILKLIDDDND